MIDPAAPSAGDIGDNKARYARALFFHHWIFFTSFSPQDEVA